MVSLVLPMAEQALLAIKYQSTSASLDCAATAHIRHLTLYSSLGRPIVVQGGDTEVPSSIKAGQEVVEKR